MTDDKPNALRIAFIDRSQGWARAEVVVYRDGRDAENSSVYEDVDLTSAGITTIEQARLAGLFRLALTASKER